MLTEERRHEPRELMRKADELTDEKRKILQWIALGMDIANDSTDGPEDGKRFKTEHIGYVVAPKKDEEKLKGHCYRITDLQTKETEVVLMEDDGSVHGITWGDSNDKGRI